MNDEHNYIMNNFAPLHGHILKQEIYTAPNPAQTVEVEAEEVPQEPIPASTLHLSSRRGVRIDFIRVMNAWYELGNVTDEKGGKLSKTEYFAQLGKAFNIDLSNYSRDLSNSTVNGNALDSQIRIFEEMREKMEEIYLAK